MKDEAAEAMRRSGVIPTWRQGERNCPQCGALLFENQDHDFECLMCGTVVYCTEVDGRRRSK